MRKCLVALSLLMSLASSGAIADSQHYGTAPTKKQAKRLATAEARETARKASSCYHPARQIRECVAVEGGFRCRAETSTRYSQCRRAGWVNEFTPSTRAEMRYEPWFWSNLMARDYGGPTYSTNWGAISNSELRMTQYLPPAPTPFPPN